MPDMSNEFPSKWLRATDITRPVTLTIASVTKEQVGQSFQWVLRFHKAQKGLVLKPGINAALMSAFGKNSDAWVGHKVQLSPASGSYQGKPYQTIAVTPLSGATSPSLPPPAPAPAPANVGGAVDEVFDADTGGAIGEDTFEEADIPF